eukprot:15309077-Ditylum_brightwellii.AAC.1
MVFNLVKEIIKNHFWEPSTLHSPNQHLVPPPERLPNHIPFHQTRTHDVSPPPLPIAKVDGYIDDACTIALDIPSNVAQGEAAVPLAIHAIFCPLDKAEPIACTDILSLCKLLGDS